MKYVICKQTGRTARFVMVAWVMMMVVGVTTICSAMTRTLKADPAIVIVAFGTTTKAGVTYEFFEQQLRASLPKQYREYKIEWAFTSEIIRERANQKFVKQDLPTRYRSLPQVLADLEDEGYRRVAIQSLHIFPGQEYLDMEREITAFRTLGMQIEYGGTLFHEWEAVFEAIEILEHEFLAPNEGSNILVVHGTPQTFPGSNSTYMGLDRYLSHKYENVFIGGVDGVLTREQALDLAKNFPLKRVRLIPVMYVAGDHIMNDIMGTEADRHGVVSWAMELEAAGFKVDSPSLSYKGVELYKGLGFYKEINQLFMDQLLESLERIEK